MSSSVHLRERWQRLCQVIEVSPVLTDKWWTCMQTKYTEVQRAYHTLEHLVEMFAHFDNWQEKLKDKTAVAFAIYFHDIVYEPKSSTNEQDSIVMFKDFSHEAKLEAVLQNATANLIDATVTHLTGEDDNKDLHFFLDFDMAVLGRPADGYDKYAAQISREYSHLDPNIYNIKRAEVLKNFLTRDHIYSTEEFQLLYEEKARNNIAREITHLQQKLGNQT